MQRASIKKCFHKGGKCDSAIDKFTDCDYNTLMSERRSQ